MIVPRFGSTKSASQRIPYRAGRVGGDGHVRLHLEGESSDFVLHVLSERIDVHVRDADSIARQECDGIRRQCKAGLVCRDGVSKAAIKSPPTYCCSQWRSICLERQRPGKAASLRPCSRED